MVARQTAIPASWPNGKLNIFNVETGADEDIKNVRAYQASWSPNGKWIAILGGLDKYYESGELVSIDGSESKGLYDRLYLLDVTTRDLQLLVPKPAAFTWSPDSQWIAHTQYANGRQLFKIRPDGSGLQKLTDTDCHPIERLVANFHPRAP